jgi:uncharacterized protein YbjT (DUF2867 family)
MDHLATAQLPGGMKTFLILGGTGKTGRRIADRLRGDGLPVRTAARTGADVEFDLGVPETWAPALDGVSAAYLLEPDLAAAGTNGPARLPALVKQAVAAGVRRFVLLSALGADDDHNPMKAVERAVRESGAEWTILRPAWFAQNFSEFAWRPGILSGSLALPTGTGRAPFIDLDDLAEVAASGLTDDRHNGQIYVLTGPQAVTFGDAVDLIAKATGRTIEYVDVDAAVYTDQLVSHGVPAQIAGFLTSGLTDIRDGKADALGDGVERALGRPATPFEVYVTRAAAAGAWN